METLEAETLDRAPAVETTSEFGGPRTASHEQHEHIDLRARRKRPRFLLEPLRSIDIERTCHWLIKGLMPRHGLMVIYGPPGSGKSFVALDAALHVAAGRPWAGRKVRQSGVVYVAAEGGRGFNKRIHAALRHHGISIDSPFALVTSAPDLGTLDGDADRLIDAIKDQTTDFVTPPQLVILDTLARSTAGADESNALQMGQFVANAHKIADALGALVIAVHHSGKDRDRGMRGSSALAGAADTIWGVDRDGDARSICVEKMKDGEDLERIAFELAVVSCGTDDEGDEITTCVTVGMKPEPARSNETEVLRNPIVSSQQQRFVAVLKEAIVAEGRPSPRNRSIPPDVMVVSRGNLLRYQQQMGIAATSPKSLQTSINRHLRQLKQLGTIGCYKDHVWLIESAG